jgi:cytoskeleton protein RodZ
MNAVATEDVVEEVIPEGPGKRLKTVREAQDLDLARVASLLHLSEAMLMALEADDYAALPGSVFVQGYLRNYARLLGVPVEPVLEAFHIHHSDKERQPDLRVAKIKHEMRSSHALIRMTTWLIVVGLLVLVVVWWRGYLQWPLQSGGMDPASDIQEPAGAEPVSDEPQMGILPQLPQMEAESEVMDEPMPESPDGQETISASDEPTAVELPQAAEEPGAAEEGVEPAMEPVREMAAAMEEQAPAVQETQIPLLKPVEVVEPEAAEPAAAPAPAHEFVIEYKDDCWSDIKDASGAFRILGVVKAGTRRVLGGTPPYKVVLGNSAGVTVSVDGEVFDHMVHTRANVARFTLDTE